MTLLNGQSINEIIYQKEHELHEKGRKERDIEIAGNMLIKGYAINEISEITGLNINSIKQLKLGK